MTLRSAQERAPILITGASGGIGGALARQAAARGWPVLLGYDTGAARAHSLAEEITAAGGRARPLRLPLTDRPAAVAAVADLAPPLPDTVVLAAAPAPPVASFLKTPSAAFAAQLDANVLGHHALLAEAWKRWFRPRGGGHVLALLTTALGPPPAPHMAAYVVAKAALRALLEAAAAELGPAGLRVSTLSPGFTETAMLRAFPPLFLERQRALRPGGRFATPEAVAAAALRALADPPPPGTVRHLSMEPEA